MLLSLVYQTVGLLVISVFLLSDGESRVLVVSSYLVSEIRRTVSWVSCLFQVVRDIVCMCMCVCVCVRTHTYRYSILLRCV